MPDDEWIDDEPVLPDADFCLDEVLGTTVERFLHAYDFGDGWNHDVTVRAVEPVDEERLERLQLQRNPAKLAAVFRKTLTAGKRSRRFVDYRAASAYAQERSAWLAQIEAELLPIDPAAALILAQAYIEADTTWFEPADDSDGVVGDTLREACRLWLSAASRCESPRDEWPGRIASL